MSQRINRRELLAGVAAAGAAVVGLTPFLGAFDAQPAISSEQIIQSMCDRGAFGDLTYASGGSIEHYRTLRRWMRIGQRDHLTTLLSRRDGATHHILLRAPRGQLIELRLPIDRATSPTSTLTLHGTRGACRIDSTGDWIYLHGRTRGNKWEPLARYDGTSPQLKQRA